MPELNPERLFHVGARVRLSSNCRHPIPEIIDEVGTVVGFDEHEASVQWPSFYFSKKHARESLEIVVVPPPPKPKNNRGRRKKTEGTELAANEKAPAE